MSEQYRLTGGTIQEKDAENLAGVIARLDEHIRIRAGLPIAPLVTDVDLIPPVSVVDGEHTETSPGAISDSALEKVIPIHVHIRLVRDELMVAQGTDDSEAYEEIKKKAV